MSQRKESVNTAPDAPVEPEREGGRALYGVICHHRSDDPEHSGEEYKPGNLYQSDYLEQCYKAGKPFVYSSEG